MIELLIYFAGFYISLGLTAWLYIGHKDEFIDRNKPLTAEILNTLMFLVGWYSIFLGLALDKLQSQSTQERKVAENLEKVLEEAGN